MKAGTAVLILVAAWIAMLGQGLNYHDDLLAGWSFLPAAIALMIMLRRGPEQRLFARRAPRPRLDRRYISPASNRLVAGGYQPRPGKRPPLPTTGSGVQSPRRRAGA